ncbi:transposase [Candidatus Accumulibacter aalborgensis]|uniref:Transposase n=1 Tax=Candidatus Accumulibacter aalborgensis TaxID=1860102 RepID=A0A1A8Y0K0_9PROT|nr:transposase [Candidatus Accumulibacter aalborgensis]
MYIARVPNRKSRPAILLRESYREGGKVCTRTIANLTNWAPERVVAMERLVKGEFDDWSGEMTSGEIFGVLLALKQLADQVGITRVLGSAAESKLNLFLILARIAHGGSRLSAVRWAKQHTVADVLGVEGFDEDDLYAALDWLASQQERIERELYQAYVKEQGQPPVLVLYDVTSSYFEGECNELGQYGYNRDGKRGKQQIVIGLLTAEDGEPLAVRVFEGNTADPTTVASQITILKEQFGIAEVVMVGDRGMIKAKGKAALSAEGFRYITALTDAQIRTFLKEGVLQTDLFDTHLCEVEHDDKRLIVRRNETVRVRERRRREDKLAQLQAKIAERNAFVKNSRRASAAAGLATLQRWAKSHKLSAFVTLTLKERAIVCTLDEEAKAQDALLDGCYLLETDVPLTLMDAKTVDARYRDLQKVERNFRTVKTTFLEIRPIFLRKAERTKAHVFVAMLALKITRRFEADLHRTFGSTEDDPAAITPDDALVALGRLTYLYSTDRNGQRHPHLPRPDEQQAKILEAIGLSFPLKPKADKRAV